MIEVGLGRFVNLPAPRTCFWELADGGATRELMAYLNSDLLPNSEAVAGMRSDGSESGAGLYDVHLRWPSLQVQRAPPEPVQ